MEIRKTKIDIKCDAQGCKHLADYCIQGKKGIIATNMYWCESCLRQLYKTIGGVLVPKSPKNIYQKEIKK